MHAYLTGLFPVGDKIRTYSYFIGVILENYLKARSEPSPSSRRANSIDKTRTDRRHDFALKSVYLVSRNCLLEHLHSNQEYPNDHAKIPISPVP